MSHSHARHGQTALVSTSPGTRWVLAASVLVLAVATLAGLWMLRPTGHGRPHVEPSLAPGVTLVTGTIDSVARLDCSDVDVPTSQTPTASATAGCGRAIVVLDGGVGPRVTVDLPPEASRAGRGVGVVLAHLPTQPGATAADGPAYDYFDLERGRPMLWLVAAFTLVVAVVARGRGIRALIGLGVSAVVVVKYLLPALLEGRNPVALGLVGSMAIMLVVLYLAHGVSARTTTALLGTTAGLLITAGIGALAVSQAHLFGVSDDTNQALQQVATQIDLRNLLTCGIILAGLGILNDVTITQSSAVWELYSLAPDASGRRLYSQAMRIGRDHIASTVYTVVFAYAGAALPILLLVALLDQPAARTLTSPDIAEEVVRTMAAGIGLVLAVPITTALTTVVVTRSGGRSAARSRRRYRG